MKWEICEVISPIGVWRARNGERELVIAGVSEPEAAWMVEALNAFEEDELEPLTPLELSRHREDKPS